ncbi:MAG: PhzF family phenazine biosynthesis protein [Acidimicrobiales bacterium]
MISVPYHLLDVFTDTQFEGNPLAVVIDAPPLTDGQMARIAGEFNLSETIFLTASGADTWTTRIFTPSQELPFAGHPTVGAAVALASLGHATREGDDASIVLQERAGDVPVDIVFDGDRVVSATFTAPRPPELVHALSGDDVAVVLASLGLEPGDALNALPMGVWSAGVPFTIVPVGSLDALGRASVDGATLRSASADVARFLYVVTPGSAHGDHWRARMFATDLGIAEDPATGGAACAFAGLLATVAADGGASWLVEQGVEMGRRSLLDLGATVRANAAVAARLGGSAVAVGEGSLRLAE